METLGLTSLQGAYDAGATSGGTFALSTSGGAFAPDGAALAAGVSGTAGPDYMRLRRGSIAVLATAFNATDNRATIYSGALNGMDISPDPALLPDRATITVAADKLTFLRQDRTILVASPAGFFAWNSTLTFNTGLVNPTIGGFITLAGTIVYQTNANPFGMGNALLSAITWSGLNGANLGPGFVFAGNNVFEADGGATLMSQARVYFDNARYRGVNGGTLTTGAIGHVSSFSNLTVEAGATVGLRRALFMQDASGAGAITEQVVVDCPDLAFATTNIGVRSAMTAANGTFISHTGDAPANFGGSIGLASGPTVDWVLSRLAANVATLADGDSLRITTGFLFMGASGTVNLTVSAANRLDLASGDSFRIVGGGGTLELPSYTVAGVPAPATAGRMVFISNETGGAVPAFDDGTNWRRVTDRAIIA